ncbi:hypothetical protein [Tenacibaculum jejuense]|uniref:hypothetical protein n=1 Tax=Tenacibaculum jejuense TaxID=584609 RepID=UPI000BA49D83|nr:hypothetical protein [Tenacibaculum jejuense]
MKKILNLKSTQILDRSTQQKIKGGWASFTCENACNEGPSNPFYFKCFCALEGDSEKRKF